MDARALTLAAIRPYRTCANEPPPISLTVLVVMALYLSECPLSDKEIFAWILRTFAFYRKLGATASCKYLSLESDGSELSDDDEMRVWSNALRLNGPTGIEGVLHEYSAPVRQLPEHHGADDDDDDELQNEGRLWTVSSAAEVIMFLKSRVCRDHVASQRGFFPFLDLPPEIRNIIYTMVLSYPSSGIKINRGHEADRSGRVYAVSRTFDRPFDFKVWQEAEPSRDQLFIGHMSSILSILGVHRQIRSEALYIFANVNTFYFTSALHMYRILSRMSPEHRDNVRSIAFKHIPDVGRDSYLSKAFWMLARMKRLKRLRIWVDQRVWQRCYYYLHAKGTAELMGFEKAERIGEEVELELDGDVPMEVEGLIRAEAEGIERSDRYGKVDQATLIQQKSCQWQVLRFCKSVTAIVVLFFTACVPKKRKRVDENRRLAANQKLI